MIAKVLAPMRAVVPVMKMKEKGPRVQRGKNSGCSVIMYTVESGECYPMAPKLTQKGKLKSISNEFHI